MLALGSTDEKAEGWSKPGHSYAEIFKNDKWTEIEKYPFHETIFRAALLYYDSFFYVFGGAVSVQGDKQNTKIIARLNTQFQWSKAGELIELRRSHAVIVSQSEFLVVGGHLTSGDDALPTEKCTISESIVCSKLNENGDPNLSQYQLYPELFNVPDSFCKNL